MHGGIDVDNYDLKAFFLIPNLYFGPNVSIKFLLTSILHLLNSAEMFLTTLTLQK